MQCMARAIEPAALCNLTAHAFMQWKYYGASSAPLDLVRKLSVCDTRWFVLKFEATAGAFFCLAYIFTCQVKKWDDVFGK